MKTKNTDNAPTTEVKAQNTDLAKAELMQENKFAEIVAKQFTGVAQSQTGLTNFQARLVSSYYYAIDEVIKQAEQERLEVADKLPDEVPISWEAIDTEKVARNVAIYTRLGLDAAADNHVSFSIIKKIESNKYDVDFMIGYKGLELKAIKYGMNPPENITIELVYKNDYFVPLKKDMKNRIENYEFEIKNPFDRGDVIGGFYYLSFADQQKNRLVVFSLADILKRRPKDYDPKFWEDQKESMYRKTIARAAYNAISIDPSKIDEDYTALQNINKDSARAKNEEIISKNANKEKIEFFNEAEIVEEKSSVAPQEEAKKKEEEDPKEVKINNATYNADGTIKFSEKAGF